MRVILTGVSYAKACEVKASARAVGIEAGEVPGGMAFYPQDEEEAEDLALVANAHGVTLEGGLTLHEDNVINWKRTPEEAAKLPEGLGNSHPVRLGVHPDDLKAALDASFREFPAIFGRFPVMTKFYFRDGIAWLSNGRGAGAMMNGHAFRRILAKRRAKETTARKKRRYVWR